jgi:hypothetical protein
MRALLLIALCSGCNFFDDYLDGTWEGECRADGATMGIKVSFGGAGVKGGKAPEFTRGIEAAVPEPKGHWEAYNGTGDLIANGTEIDVQPSYGECRSPVCHAGPQRDADASAGHYPAIDEGIYPRGAFFISVTPPFNSDHFLIYGELDGDKTSLEGPCRFKTGTVEHVGTGTLTKTASCHLTTGIPSFVCDDPP